MPYRAGKYHAKEYSKKEKFRLLIIYGSLVILLFIVSEKWLFPWLREFVETIHCQELWGISGIKLLIYGLFVGLPVSLLPLGIYLSHRGLKIIHEQQFPPAGEKVFRKTKIVRGKAAILRGYAHHIVLLSIVGIAIWGYLTAAQFDLEKIDRSSCIMGNKVGG